MKTKKELDSARKMEGEVQVAMASLTAQLEAEKQLAEQNKVGPPVISLPLSLSSIFFLSIG